MIRFALAATLLLASFPALAQAPASTLSTPADGPPIVTPMLTLSPPPPVPAPRPGTVRVTLVTGEGPILLELEKERAPITTANFLRYVDEKRLDGTNFYRALKLRGAELGLIQGGVGQDGKRLLPPVAHEPTTKTGLAHGDGTISMARGAPGSAAGDFFITIGPLTSLDANPEAAGDNLGFAVFGRVVDGMETVRRILNAPISATAGEGVMKGQMLAKPIQIQTARRTR